MKRKDVTYKVQKRWESENEDEDEKVEVEFYLVKLDNGRIELRAVVDDDEDYYLFQFDQEEGIIRASGIDWEENRKIFPVNRSGVIKVSKEIM